MTKTIAINAGSSSLKWQLYEMPDEVVLAKGLIERIGLKDSVSTVKFDDRSESQTLDIADHVQAVKILLDDLIRFDIIKSYDEITGVGHRVVAGGEYFKESSLVDEDALAKIEELSALAPLHNPGAASGIRAFKELLPDITSVAVFDTAFHTSMPEVAYRYPVPNRYYTDYQVRKYGAHGTSHQYVSQEAAKLLGKPIEETKIITAHVGNGVSITAVDGGKSVDTSMGLTLGILTLRLFHLLLTVNLRWQMLSVSVTSLIRNQVFLAFLKNQVICVISLLVRMLVIKNVPWPMIFMWIVCVNTSLNTSVC